MTWQTFFLLTILLLPFSFAIGPSAGVDLPVVRILFPLLGVWWLLHGLTFKHLVIDYRVRFWAWILLLFWCGLSLSWAIDQDRAMRKLLFLLMFTPAYMMAYDLWRSSFRVKLMQAMVHGGTLLAFVGLGLWSLQFVIGIDATLQLLSKTTVPFFLGDAFAKVVLQYPSWLVNISGSTVLRTFGTLPDPHIFSLYLNLCLPFGVWLFLETKQTRYLFISTIILVASLLSFARAGYLALASAIIFFLVHHPFVETIKRKPVLILLAIMIIGATFLTSNPLANRFYNSFNLKEGSSSGRLEMWHRAWQTSLDYPITGVGLGNFGRYIKPDAPPREPIYAHNLYLDFAAETGLASAIILFFIVIAPIISYWRTPSPFGKYLALTMVIFLVHALFETPVYSVHILPLLLILLAAPSRLHPTTRDPCPS